MTRDQDDSSSGVGAEQADEIMEAWQEFDDTGDITVLADYLAEDVIHSPPGAPPIVGKDALLEHLDGLDPTEAGWEIQIDDLVVGEDLAVARSTIVGEPSSNAAGDPEKVSLSSIDVFQRQNDGSWNQIISHPNGNG